MDNEIKDIISKIYIYHEDNQATNEEIVNKMKNDLENTLSKIKGISVSISISHDPEYKRIEYGENCAVALDVFVYVPNNEHTMVVQISKLGKFAQYYWKLWKPYEYFSTEMPEGWPSSIYHEVCDAIQKYGLRILEAKELDEPFEGVVKYIIGDNEGELPETVGGLLFCYDGPH